MNRIFGGFRGKSSGKDKRALKKPPSLPKSALSSYIAQEHPGMTYYIVSGGLIGYAITHINPFATRGAITGERTR